MTSGEEEKRIGRSILDRALSPAPRPFALVARDPHGDGRRVEAFEGVVREFRHLAQIPLPDPGRSGPRQDSLVLLPYRQITERGFEARDDGEPILALRIENQGVLSEEDLGVLSGVSATIRGGSFDVSDAEYERVVEEVVAKEIGSGAGSNFVISRTFTTQVEGDRLRFALGLFHRLLGEENGAYWTFVVHTGERTFVGATPERHVSLHRGTAAMNPISGTYHYPEEGPTLQGLLDFVTDRKEIDELYMVVDEELKMMAEVCRGGGRVHGPRLKPMARLAHTEYDVSGPTSLDPRGVLERTMFAPTVVGSPLENACRVVARYETSGRGYYSGAIALIGTDAGERTLDSAIMIRTARISPSGQMGLRVGATLVRGSVPSREAAETHAKAAGLLGAAGGGTRRAAAVRNDLADHPRVRAALEARNTGLADFWLAGREPAGAVQPPPLLGRKVLVVNAEDAFTGMLAHQLRSLGGHVDVVPHDMAEESSDTHDLVVVGPGPGDPRDTSDRRVSTLHRVTRALLDGGRPFLSVCLGHQVLAAVLGLGLRRRPVPAQGTRREIDLFGERATVAFYNTYVAVSPVDRVEGPTGPVLVGRDASGEVHALRGPHFASMQFHPESLLTHRGPELIAASLCSLGEPVGDPHG
ncbi:anthranilate synthase family protein [Nocardiopsis dassonvillei]|uniref:anthranilate synthase family protein n=1 Tax=Nocardiopsis dassonvillei TaxID=2014 RepID=UPI00366DDC7D